MNHAAGNWRPDLGRAARGLCVLALGLWLAGCGGGDLSWCLSNGSGSMSAGFNTSDCPPRGED